MKSYTLEMADGSGLSEGHFNSDKEAVAWAVSVLEQRGNDAAELVTGDWETRNPDSVRKLFWADEQSAEDDAGANAIAHLVKQDTANEIETEYDARTPMQIVASGIVDPCQAEFVKKNLRDWESVHLYAWNACEIYLDQTESEKVLRACLAYLADKSGNTIEHFI